jgi:hypothetical protein
MDKKWDETAYDLWPFSKIRAARSVWRTICITKNKGLLLYFTMLVTVDHCYRQ